MGATRTMRHTGGFVPARTGQEVPVVTVPRVTAKRVYDEPDDADGARILVDRIWPRGLRRDAARLDDWLSDVAPSHELRRWYGHDPARFAEFADRYRAELADAEHAAAVRRLREYVDAGPTTLLTATRDLAHAQTAVLVDLLTAGGRLVDARERHQRRRPG
ncbi:DUF488 domain-containing protein [Planosporangium sp. 12N6]|uniref:DUF488 domain-containing protein n=1 Tax=Planosporangium spinosum TaxID=3402278 RepID=UPI003CF5DD95